MMSTFGQRLRLLRDEKKMVQKEIADLLDVSQSTIGKYEGDQRTPSPDTIIKLAVFFEVSTDYLLGHSEIRNPLCSEYQGRRLSQLSINHFEFILLYQMIQQILVMLSYLFQVVHVNLQRFIGILDIGGFDCRFERFTFTQTV
jgi:transcriptional regulator with XRE-family HTH domain